jgi:hypothetical protein
MAARLLTRLYPRCWRERYGAEFEVFLQDGDGGVRAFANVLRSALCERIVSARGDAMNQHPYSFGAVTRQPSGFLPVVMSLTALAMVLGSLAMYGVHRGGDEGAVAHLWQLLMAGQVPIIAFFAIRWLPRAPRQTLGVLALQAGAAMASMAPVFLLNL